MKQYTVQEAAMALGVDIQTLNNWLSRDGGNQPYIDPHNPQQYVLNQAQVEQLAREHNVSLLVPQPQAYNNGVVQAGMPSTLPPRWKQPGTTKQLTHCSSHASRQW